MRGSVAVAKLALGFGLLSACTSGGEGARGGGAAGSQAASGASATGGVTNGNGGGGSASMQSGGSGAGVAGELGQPDDDAPTTSVSFTPSSAIILNPERGFYATTNLSDASDLSELRAAGVTLVHSYVRLDDYRTSDIPGTLLTQVSEGLTRVRAAGVKVILRFAYNFGPYPDSEPDAPQAWVLKHIAQLAPLLEDNADVIAVVQAGFIGAWGEWHTSTNDLTQPPARQAILEALLAAVPKTRCVQLRYPPHKRALYGDPLTAANAFGDTPAARVGHHNDCFVSSATDVGTYPDAEVDFYRDYVGADTAFVPMGGETCAVSAPRSECESAVAEMTKLHMSYVNGEFQSEVLESWQPCRDELEKRLGYRLLLTTGKLPPQVKPGGSFVLEVALENQGFAAPFNARPVFVVLRGNGTTARVRLTRAEPRRWLEGGALSVRLRLPSQLAPGRYTLSLWLPDAAESLMARPEYALRLANEDSWDEASGENRLGEIEVSADAPGRAVSDAQTLTILAE